MFTFCVQLYKYFVGVWQFIGLYFVDPQLQHTIIIAPTVSTTSHRRQCKCSPPIDETGGKVIYTKQNCRSHAEQSIWKIDKHTLAQRALTDLPFFVVVVVFLFYTHFSSPPFKALTHSAHDASGQYYLEERKQKLSR